MQVFLGARRAVIRERVAKLDPAFVLVILASIGFGLNPLFARLAYADGISPSAALFWRMCGLTLLTMPLLVSALRKRVVMLRGLCLGAGMAVGTLSYFKALAVLPVATAAMVYYTYPLFTVLIGWLGRGRKPCGRTLLSVAAVLAAVGLIVTPQGLAEEQLVALLACFLAPLAFALLLHGHVAWMSDAAILERNATTSVGHMIVLVPAAFVFGDGNVMAASQAGWLAVLGLATVAALLPQVCLAYGTVLAGAERTAIAGSTELVVAVITGWLILGESVRPMAVFGVLLLTAAVFTVRQPPRSSQSVAKVADRVEA